jgi:hypothetical protein
MPPLCRAGEEWLWLSGCTVVEGPRSWTVQEWRRGLHRYYIPDATREQARELSRVHFNLGAGLRQVFSRDKLASTLRYGLCFAPCYSGCSNEAADGCYPETEIPPAEPDLTRQNSCATMRPGGDRRCSRPSPSLFKSWRPADGAQPNLCASASGLFPKTPKTITGTGLSHSLRAVEGAV